MRTRALLPIIACGWLLAACGGASNSGHAGASKGSSYGPKNSPYALSKCMRANGLTHFPDPSRGPGGGGVGFPGGVIVSVEGDLTVNGVTYSGPALRQASKACKIYLPPGGPPPKISAAMRRQGLELAQCMRAHGVPNFPDPGGNIGAGAVNKQAPLPDATAPAFKHAVQVCGRGGQIQVRGGNVLAR
jgi:hypothetical protein